METDKDHVHFLIRYIPSLSTALIVGSLKQESTPQLGQLHGSTLGKQYGYQHLFWPDGYFCLVGEASPETIRPYI